MAAARWHEMSEPTKVSGYDALWFADKEAVNDMLRLRPISRRLFSSGIFRKTLLHGRPREGASSPYR